MSEKDTYVLIDDDADAATTKPVKKEKKKTTPGEFLFSLIIMFAIIVWYNSDSDAPSTPNAQAMPVGYAMTFVKSNLDDRGSFDMIDYKAWDMGTDHSIVNLTFTAKNAFGGRVKQTWKIKVFYTGSVALVETYN